MQIHSTTVRPSDYQKGDEDNDQLFNNHFNCSLGVVEAELGISGAGPPQAWILCGLRKSARQIKHNKASGEQK
jgi:hypothetical protein